MPRAKILIEPGKVAGAALELIESEGQLAFSTRKLSDKLNISPMTLYNYYENKDAILKEALIVGIQRFSKHQFGLLRSKLKSGENPLEYFLMLPESLLDFGKARPKLYQFLFDVNNSEYLKDTNVVEEYQRGFKLVERHIMNPKDKKKINSHVYLYEVISNTLVIRCLKNNDLFPSRTCLRLSREAYDRLLKPDEGLLKPLNLSLLEDI